MLRHRVIGVTRSVIALARPVHGAVSQLCVTCGSVLQRSYTQQAARGPTVPARDAPTPTTTTAARPRRVIPPAAVALRQMAGLPGQANPDETEEQRAARLKREASIAKAAAIEAARLARERLEVVKPVPENSLPEEIAPSTSKQQPKPSPLKTPYESKLSPFKKFNPFFDYETALDEATTLQSQDGKGPKTAVKPSKSKSNSQQQKEKNKSAIATKKPPSSPRPPPIDPTKLALSMGERSSSHVPFSPLPSKIFKPSKVLQAREEQLKRNETERWKTIEQDAMSAARAALEREGEENLDGDAAPQFDVADSEPAAAAQSQATHSKRRGPASPADLINANKHKLKTKHLPSDAEDAKKKKQNKKDKQKQSKPKKVEIGPDGKMPLQSSNGPVSRPRVIPWHPALFVKQFLMKIHPDLYHTPEGGGKERVLVGEKSEGEEMTSCETMVRVNQDTVAKFNAIVDYYKQVKSLPVSTLRVPATPVLPNHPQTILFYCRVRKDAPDEIRLEDLAKEDSQFPTDDANAPQQIKLFEGTFSLSSYDLSSLPRLISAFEIFFIRLVLTTQVRLDISVRKRWEVLIRQRMITKEMWAKGELELEDLASTGYLKQDPTASSYNQSPGRYKKDYMRFYAQTKSSHEAIQEGRGYKADLLYNPYDPSALKLPPLLEQMMRSGLLQFDSDLDMVHRLHCLQTMIHFMSGYDLTHLYPHLWLGVKIQVRPVSFEYDDPDHNYRFTTDEWEIPYNFEREKLVRLIRQYLYAYHADNPEGLTLLEKL